MSRPSFLLYKSFYEPIKHLSNEELGSLFRAIFEFQNLEINPENPVGYLETKEEIQKNLPPQIQMAFAFFVNQFDLDAKKYQNIVNRNKSNGSKGGRPKNPKEKENPENPVGYLAPKKPEKEKEKEKDIISYKDKSLKEIALPDFIKKENWQAFAEMRKKQKKPLTEKAIELTLTDLVSFEKNRAGNANLALENSIKGSYQGVFEPRPEKGAAQEKKSSYHNFKNNDYSAPEGFNT